MYLTVAEYNTLRAIWRVLELPTHVEIFYVTLHLFITIKFKEFLPVNLMWIKIFIHVKFQRDAILILLCCERRSAHKTEETKERINSTVEFYQTLPYPSSYSLQRILIINESFLFVKVLIRCCDQVPIRILSKHEWIIVFLYNSSVILLCSIRILSKHEWTFEFLILISSHYQISVRILSNHEQVLSCNLSVCLIMIMLYDVLSNNE